MDGPGAHIVIGTAGHIDHGKTSLVRRLTGVDLDALPEEQARGITIALGFTPLDLPDGRRVAFVDVPGHERLVRTMVAGATGIDGVLLCVSAVDGVMPQTREHLAILDLLGVRAGAVALTMADLVDEELLELAIEEVREALAGTTLADAPILPFSAVTGRGVDEVTEALAALPVAEHDLDGPFRLPVDRTFVQTGFGTVVTGTVRSGRVKDGETVLLLPAGTTTRVRGMQVHGAKADASQAGWRTALNLAGVEAEDVSRGTVIARRPLPCPHVVDLHYRHLASAEPLHDGTSVRLLLGTAEAVGKLYVVDVDTVAPGAEALVQVRLDAPIPMLPGDRFILRRPSPQETLGGGRVLDPWAPKLKKKLRTQAQRQLARLVRGDRRVFLERAGEQGLSAEEWAQRGDGTGCTVGDRVLAEPVVARLEGALLEALTAFHAGHPLVLGANRRELRRDRLGHLSERVFDGLIARLADGPLIVDGPVVRLKGFAVALDAGQRDLQQAILGTIRAAGLVGVAPKALHEAHPEPEVAALARLIEADGAAEQVAGIGWVAREALVELSRQVRAWFADHDTIAPGDLKEFTGLTRKSAIPMLEWLDKQRITQRRGDRRTLGTA